MPGACRIPEAGVRINCTLCGAPARKTMREKRSSHAFLEPSRLPPSLLVRPRAPGDRYGGPGHRKVKKMLIDSKIPQLHRPALPMIVAGNDVIWIPGFRAARGYEAKPDSPICVCIEMSSL
jgi:tRNA(Ile)-lysidine synthase